jgi:RNA polymerase sigma factor (TIGR02999 family)
MTTPTPSPACTFESIYAALRAQARHYLRREQNAYSMSPTVLVHEAWVALARSQAVDIQDTAHYVRLVSRVMKNLIIDHARKKRALINGGGMIRIDCDQSTIACAQDCETVLAVAGAMEQLAAVAPELASLAELRYFSGFTESEAAQILGISIRTVRRQWRVARIRLLEYLQNGEAEAVTRA